LKICDLDFVTVLNFVKAKIKSQFGLFPLLQRSPFFGENFRKQFFVTFLKERMKGFCKKMTGSQSNKGEFGANLYFRLRQATGAKRTHLFSILASKTLFFSLP